MFMLLQRDKLSLRRLLAFVRFLLVKAKGEIKPDSPIIRPVAERFAFVKVLTSDGHDTKKSASSRRSMCNQVDMAEAIGGKGTTEGADAIKVVDGRTCLSTLNGIADCQK